MWQAAQYLGRVEAHERLHERAAMRLGVEIGEKPVHRANQRLAARGEPVQRGIGDGEPAVAHRALDLRDGVAGRAGQPRLRLRRVDLLGDRPIEAAVEEDRMIVAARTPLARPRPDDRLHVLDGLPVELVVERGEVMDRALPLLVHVLVALPAQFRVEEEVRGNRAADVGLGGRWEERRGGSTAFAVHRRRRRQRIDDPIARHGAGADPRPDRAGHDRQQRRGRQVGPSEPSLAAGRLGRQPPRERQQCGDGRRRRRRRARPAPIASRQGCRAKRARRRTQPPPSAPARTPAPRGGPATGLDAAGKPPPPPTERRRPRRAAARSPCRTRSATRPRRGTPCSSAGRAPRTRRTSTGTIGASRSCRVSHS